ncbi:TIGR03621 family F420-dependent LLM class oxidoreductase [Pseudonocardia halophobica]|uniref:TIGR03621 family F420-dependent LLM class oxidoreductase n=1 Tax=Pseudonocardia halophobica TaxID=29401 RepID=UPI003D8EF974
MRPFRFGVNLTSFEDRATWVATCRRVEEQGYDVLLVPDHLGMPAPFPALAAAADATERVRLGTFVLNAGFWNPTLLAREVATLDQLSGGRFELGLGTGYNRAEFDAAGLPFGSPGERVSALEDLVGRLDTALVDGTPRPAQQPRPPLLLGGNGDRMLRLAARRADTVAFAGATLKPGSTTGELLLLTAEELDGRIALAAEAAGERDPERNLLVQVVAVVDDRRAGIEQLRARFGVDYLTVDQMLELPTLLVGTVDEIVEQLRAARERFGTSYVTVLQPSAEAFAPVIEKLR